jgi:hypothetical protein
MKKHTNITNEITGDYYRKNKFFEESIDWGLVGGTVAMIVGAGVVYWLAS